MKRYYVDIETTALPLDLLIPIMPEFEPAANLKDENKIKQSIADKKDAWLASCALRATTGRIIAASSAWDDQEVQFHCSPDEQTMLDILVHDITTAISLGGRVYGWNLFGFDLPFLTQRAAIAGKACHSLFTTNYRGRWSWNEAFVDPMQVWAGPGNRHDGCSLKAVAFSLGLGLKSGDGKDFSELLKTDPVKAKEYSVNDTNLLRRVVERMGV